MATPEALYKATVTRLREATSITVYEGEVASRPPAEPGSGRVYPYAVVWPSGGFIPEEARGVSGRTAEELDWPVSVTVVAGDATWCLQATKIVRDKLDGYVLAPGAGALQEEPTGAMMSPDRDVVPVRFFVPLLFRNLST